MHGHACLDDHMLGDAALLQGPGFQTAKAKLAADVRTGRTAFNPKDLSSGPMFPQGRGAVSHGHRAGLHRPPGSRAPQGTVRICTASDTPAIV